MTDFEVDAFFAIAETHSITLAADKLGITQSALSRRIMSLEESLGYELLIHQKGARNVQLTENGKKFYFIAQKWKLIWEEAKNLPTSHNTPTIRISAPDSISSYVLPAVYENFFTESPRIHLVCNTALSSMGVENVESGSIDIAFSCRTPRFSPLINVEQLYTEPLVCVCGKDSPYVDGIQPSDLDPTKEVRIIVTEDFESWHSYWYPDGHRPLYFMDKFSYSFFDNFPLFNENWAFVPATVARNLVKHGSIRTVQVRNAPPNRTVYYVVQNGPKSEELNAFIKCLKETIKTMPWVNPF